MVFFFSLYFCFCCCCYHHHHHHNSVYQFRFYQLENCLPIHAGEIQLLCVNLPYRYSNRYKPWQVKVFPPNDSSSSLSLWTVTVKQVCALCSIQLLLSCLVSISGVLWQFMPTCLKLWFLVKGTPEEFSRKVFLRCSVVWLAFCTVDGDCGEIAVLVGASRVEAAASPNQHNLSWC